MSPSTTGLDLESAIQQYAVALECLTPHIRPTVGSELEPIQPIETKAPEVVASTTQISEAQVLTILIARDQVQAMLEGFISTNDSPASLGESLGKISQLDQTLKEHADIITTYAKAADWRASFNPDTKAWWWWLEAPKGVWSDRLDWLWSAASITCLTISLGLIGDIAPRFLTGTPDTLGAFTVSAQSILTLLAAGGALTKAGQEALKRCLRQINYPEKYWPALGFTGSVALVLVLFSLRQSLPQFATNFYTNPGLKSYRDGDWSTAETQFNRAIKLNAEDIQAHFQLGNLYEDLQLPDQARPQYQLAIQGGNPAAINNLARLNILKKDYNAAISLLLKALETEQKHPFDVKTKHAVLKNLGWARLKQANYPDAEARLGEAIDLEAKNQFNRDEIADTHCLLAQVLEAQKETKEALAQWKICNQNANITIPEQDEWVAIAQKRLTPSVPHP
ncbi:MAG: tetratricopeptide repeat protein [Leptolyngbya sp. BL-A-14]